MNNFPSLYVITINYNRSNLTVDCVKSIINSKYPRLQIVVIDNCSEEDDYQSLVLSLSSYNEVKIIRNSYNRGLTGGINTGLEYINKKGTDYILIIQNDSIIAEESIINLIKVSEEHERKAIVSGKVFNIKDKKRLTYIGQAIDPKNGINYKPIVHRDGEIDNGQYDKEISMGMLDDIFWMFHVNLYKKIGGYSSYFFIYAEQFDYAMRAKENGYKLIYTPKARLFNYGCSTDKDEYQNKNRKNPYSISISPRVTYWNIQGTFKVAHLYLSRSKARRFIFISAIKQLITSFKYSKGKDLLNNIKAIFLAYLHYRHWKIIKYNDPGYNPFI